MYIYIYKMHENKLIKMSHCKTGARIIKQSELIALHCETHCFSDLFTTITRLYLLYRFAI